MNTVTERPVRRDPKTGLLCQYPAYEGWRPRQGKNRNSWWLVLVGIALIIAYNKL